MDVRGSNRTPFSALGEYEGYSFPVYYDIEYNASNTYGVRSIPQTVLINADGSLYDTRVGAMSEVVLENYIKQMIGEEQ